jgi:polyisoprenoid-binding protein YceI
MMSRAIVALILLGAAPALAASIHFTAFDQNHSTIGFAVPIAGGVSEVDGKFTSFAADLVYDDADVTKSTITVVIQAATVNTGIPDRDEPLRSAEFFDVAAHPEIRFTSTRVTKRGDALIVSGTLDLHGVRKPLDLTCRLAPLRSDEKTGAVVIGGSATATIDRREFGLTWEHPVPGFVGDQVTISIHFITKLTPREAPSPAPQASPRGGPE